MKKYLEKQIVFDTSLKGFSLFAKSTLFNFLTYWLTTASARLNISLNKPLKAENVHELAIRWQSMMPPDGQEHFRVTEILDDTAYTEIHLHCPLRGSGNTHACYRLMNYERKLMEKVGGQLIVLESQSSSGRDFCRLAIRKQGQNTSDLKQAHENNT